MRVSDTSTAGWVVARSLSLPATKMYLYRIGESAGVSTIQSVGKTVTVPSYDVPAPAVQAGAGAFPIETSDTRFTQAIQAVDPAHNNVNAIWTQHTALGGAGAEVRWYEINPTPAAAGAIIQKGKVTSTTFFNFNAAISSDRVVKGATKAFGDAMVLQWVRSNSATVPTIRTLSKIGTAAASTQTTVKKLGSLDDFSCGSGECRFGDYASLTPDPSAPTTGTHGIVWGTNELGGGISPVGFTQWVHWLFVLTP